MADNITVLNYASVSATIRAVDIGGGTVAMASVPFNSSGTAMLGQAIMASSLPVAIASNQSSLPVSLGTVGNVAFALGQAVMGTSLPVAIASNQSVIPVALGTVSGVAFTLGQKIMATSLPVAIASDQSSLPVTVNSSQLGTLGQTTMINSIPVVIASNQSQVPFGVAGYTSMPTSVANGIGIVAYGDKFGRAVTLGSLRELRATQTASLTTAAETTIVNALNATTYADLYGVLLANYGSTTSRVDIRYGTGSAIVMSYQVVAGTMGGFIVNTGDAIPGSLQTANVSWTAQCSATTTIACTTLYIKNNTA